MESTPYLEVTFKPVDSVERMFVIGERITINDVPVVVDEIIPRRPRPRQGRWPVITILCHPEKN
jgi:hypothetical protein